MRVASILVAMLFIAIRPIHGQIERSGGLDATSSACRGLTCTWASAAPLHQQIAGYEFFLDPVPDDSPGSLVVKLEGKELLRTDLKNISASVTITCSLKCHTFAVTWSDGGAIGIFHVRVFRMEGAAFVEIKVVDRAFKQFKSRHYCATRGDNIQAYRFDDQKTLMLILSVYPTGDCGSDLGFTQGYIVRISDGGILRVLSKHALDNYMRKHPEGS